MNAPVRFKSTMCPPPGGTFYYEIGGERVQSPNWFEMRRLALELMRRHNVPGTPERAVAEFMCPDMPSWYCTAGGRKTLLSHELRENAKPYFFRHVVPVDEVARRLSVCQKCPKHSRSVCLTCTGHLAWVLAGFGDRRPRLPEDSLSGTCECAKTFESVVASVDGDLPEWEDVPETCWRNRK